MIIQFQKNNQIKFKKFKNNINCLYPSSLLIPFYFVIFLFFSLFLTINSLYCKLELMDVPWLNAKRLGSLLTRSFPCRLAIFIYNVLIYIEIDLLD